MEIRPILSALSRHKTAAALIVLEIALTCAIICNALFLINGRIERMDRVSGLAEAEIIRVQLTGIGRDENALAMTKTDLASLRGLPGVTSASVTNQVPFGNSSWNTGIRLSTDQTQSTLSAAYYMGDETLLDSMGLTLVAGRRFNRDELLDWETLSTGGDDASIPSAIITRKMADKLFPGEDPLGKAFYSMGGPNPTRVVGVVEHLIRPSEQGGPEAYEYAMLLPIDISYGLGSNYLLRVDPERRTELLKLTVDTLLANNPNRIILNEHTLTDMRATYYRQDRSMMWMLVAVIVALLIVTALGIIGLASFWVQQRSKQIGIRRALGATRSQILRYFQIENFLLATVGIAIGMVLAFGINQMLMGRYELPRLPLVYLPVGAIALWLLGQLAVLGPARRAASVPPAVATRSV
ncbi:MULTISPECIES: ABC transporter permease [unclassified Luteimonas]